MVGTAILVIWKNSLLMKNLNNVVENVCWEIEHLIQFMWLLRELSDTKTTSPTHISSKQMLTKKRKNTTQWWGAICSAVTMIKTGTQRQSQQCYWRSYERYDKGWIEGLSLEAKLELPWRWEQAKKIEVGFTPVDRMMQITRTYGKVWYAQWFRENMCQYIANWVMTPGWLLKVSC